MLNKEIVDIKTIDPSIHCKPIQHTFPISYCYIQTDALSHKAQIEQASWK